MTRTRVYTAFAVLSVLTVLVEVAFLSYLLASRYAPETTDRVGLTNILTDHQPIPGDRDLKPRQGGLRQALVEDLGTTIDDFAATRRANITDSVNVQPGSQLEFTDGPIVTFCSAGAWVKVYDQPMLFTAGHCHPTGTIDVVGNQNDTRRYVLGKNVSSVLDDDHDVLAMSSRAGKNSVTITGGRALDLIVDTAKPEAGKPVCALGRTTGWRCGILLSAGRSLTATFCSDSGDSGGPIIQGNRIIGFVTRSAESGDEPVCKDPARSQGTYNTGRRDTVGTYGVRVGDSIAAIEKVLN